MRVDIHLCVDMWCFHVSILAGLSRLISWCLHLQYDELTSKHIDQLRQLTKRIQDARIARDNDAIKTSLEVRQQVAGELHYNRITRDMAHSCVDLTSKLFLPGIVFPVRSDFIISCHHD